MAHCSSRLSRVLASDNLHIAYTVNQPFAALEAYSFHNHDVLLSGAYQDSGLSGTLTNAVLNDPTGWYGLGTAQVAVTTADGLLRVINGQSIATQALAPSPSGSLGIPLWLIIGLAVVFALIVVRILWLIIGTRRMRRRRAAAERQRRDESLHGDAPLTSPGDAEGVRQDPDSS